MMHPAYFEFDIATRKLREEYHTKIKPAMHQLIIDHSKARTPEDRDEASRVYLEAIRPQAQDENRNKSNGGRAMRLKDQRSKKQISRELAAHQYTLLEVARRLGLPETGTVKDIFTTIDKLKGVKNADH
jgi:hypothetical protein